MKFSRRSYGQPTPRNLRRLGDALLAGSAVITSSSIAGGNNVLAYIALGVGVIGKFLTNFFTEKEMGYIKPNIEMYLKASEFYGLTEIVGEKHNQTILDWFADIGFDWIDDDETAWCSCFINWVALKCGCERSFKLNARSWLFVGEETLQPELGDVVVLWRESIVSWKGHVGLYAGKDGNGDIYLLAGNQNNQVNISLKDKDRVLGYRRLQNV